jgi:hypothetical protein
MSSITTEIVLDALNLLVNYQEDVDLEKIDNLIYIHKSDKTYNASTDNGLTHKFVNFLEKIRNLPNDNNASTERARLAISFLSDPILKADTLLSDAVKSIFEKDKESNPRIANELKLKLKNVAVGHYYSQKIKSIWNQLNSFNSCSDPQQQEDHLSTIANLARDLSESVSLNDRLSKGVVERINMNDTNSLLDALALRRAREEKGILRTGLQGLNRMFGKRGGLALGESVCIYALLHNFKSGLLMTILRGVLCYNLPPAHFKGKPLVLFISLENEANKNLYWFYKVAYETTSGESAEGKTDDEIVEFVQRFYLQQGWHFFIERWSSNEFGYDEFVQTIEAYEAEGYELAIVAVDYALKMKKTSKTVSVSNQRDDLLITALFNNMCTYTKSKGITFITPHQLNRDVMKNIMNQSSTNHVKNFTAAGAAGSLGASQEVDLEIFVHLEKNHRGRKFLTMQRGKHRYVDDTPESHQYCAYPFTVAGIGDDILKDTPDFVEDIYSDEEEAQNTTEMAAIDILL